MKLTETITADTFSDVWVLGELSDRKLHKVTHELLGIARELSDDISKKKKSEVVCLLVGSDLKGAAEESIHALADKVITIDDPSLKLFNDELYGTVISRIINKYNPEILLSGATSKGRSIMPRLAVMLETGLTADCTELSIDSETGLLLQTRPAYGGNIIATIKCEDYRPQMSTVRQGVFKAPEKDSGRTGEIINEPLIDTEKETNFTVLNEEKNSDIKIDLHEANIIIAGGRGVQSPEGFDILKELADLVGGAVGASRATIDSGWIPYPHQVGQTGQTVQPKIYIACGISGQIQHLVGMQSSDFIVAINKDPDAPIMQLADVAVVGNLFEIVPEMIKLLKAG